MRYSALVLSFLRHSQSSHLEHWRTVCNSSVFRGFGLHFPECSDLQTIKALEMSWFFSKLFLLTPLTWNRIYTCIGPYCVVLTLDSLSYIWTCLFAEVEMQRQKGEVRREKKEPCQYKVVQSTLSSAVGCKKPYNHQWKISKLQVLFFLWSCVSRCQLQCTALLFLCSYCLYSLFSAVRHHAMQWNCSCKHDPASYIRSLCKHIFLYFSPFSAKDEIVISWMFWR